MWQGNRYIEGTKERILGDDDTMTIRIEVCTAQGKSSPPTDS